MARTYTPYGAPKKTGKGTGITVFKENDDGRDKSLPKKDKKIEVTVPDYKNIWARESYDPVRHAGMGEMTGRISI
jgi:hypothetical protein